MQVQAAVAVGAGQPFELKTLELDDPRDDEVLVRIVGVGVCHTDIVFKEGQVIAPPVVLGHEGSGVVEKVGAAVSAFAPAAPVRAATRVIRPIA
jgi:aryl-alcohol dehydrogenase